MRCFARKARRGRDIVIPHTQSSKMLTVVGGAVGDEARGAAGFDVVHDVHGDDVVGIGVRVPGGRARAGIGGRGRGPGN